MSVINIPKTLQQATQFHQAGRLQQAEQLYRQILAAQPNNVDALCYLGAIALEVNQFDASIQLLSRALAINPNFPVARFNLGNTFLRKADFASAISNFQQALAMKPDFADAYRGLGMALLFAGKSDEALPPLQRALALRPHSPAVSRAIAEAHRRRAEVDLAVTVLRQAIVAAGPTPTALPARIDLAEVYNMLAGLLKDKGRLEESIALFRIATELNPNFAAAHSNLVYSLYFHPAYDSQTILREARLWNDKHAAPLASKIVPHANNASPDRPLRIGYVSPDFRMHVIGRLILPLLAHHDHTHFQIYCYSSVLQPDGFTAQAKSYADVWRDAAPLSHANLANLIRQDQIDILVDITTHMSQNRLLTFAVKPAPIQVTWLSYPCTSGLSTMDYRLTDPHLDPPAAFDNNYSEKTVWLPDTFWCYYPLTSEPAPNSLPAEKNGYITFGCLNNFCKVNDNVLHLWSRLLHAVPTSKLLLGSPPGEAREDVLKSFASHGIDPARLDFAAERSHEKYLELYHQIDIALDTFPYNGHTTTLDSLWMGVPVVTLVGNTIVGRAGLCQLTNLALPNLIAHTEEDYLAIASTLSSDLPRLAHLRSTLRPLLQSSPLMDAPRFARNMEAVYRTMWQDWCAKKSPADNF